MADASHTARSVLRTLALAALLPALAVPAIALAGPTPADRAKREQTLATMRALIDALLGTPSSPGYIADMGQVPATLETLSSGSAPAGTPSFSLLSSGAVGTGFRGPYIARASSPSGKFVDGWGVAISMVTTSSTLQLHSGGPDRNLATTGDNVVYPLTPAVTHGTIEVKVDCAVTGLLGILPCDLTALTASVGVSNGGNSGTLSIPLVSGLLQSSGVHVGPHVVSVSARVPSDFDLGTASTRVLLRGRRAQAKLKLIEKQLLSLPTGYPICCRWTHPDTTLYGSYLMVLLHAFMHGDKTGVCP